MTRGTSRPTQSSKSMFQGIVAAADQTAYTQIPQKAIEHAAYIDEEQNREFRALVHGVTKKKTRAVGANMNPSNVKKFHFRYWFKWLFYTTLFKNIIFGIDNLLTGAGLVNQLQQIHEQESSTQTPIGFIVIFAACCIVGVLIGLLIKLPAKLCGDMKLEKSESVFKTIELVAFSFVSLAFLDAGLSLMPNGLTLPVGTGLAIGVMLNWIEVWLDAWGDRPMQEDAVATQGPPTPDMSCNSILWWAWKIVCIGTLKCLSPIILLFSTIYFVENKPGPTSNSWLEQIAGGLLIYTWGVKCFSDVLDRMKDLAKYPTEESEEERRHWAIALCFDRNDENGQQYKGMPLYWFVVSTAIAASLALSAMFLKEISHGCPFFGILDSSSTVTCGATTAPSNVTIPLIYQCSSSHHSGSHLRGSHASSCDSESWTALWPFFIGFALDGLTLVLIDGDDQIEEAWEALPTLPAMWGKSDK